tara:strand:+ start:1262 stop:1621 length:360 start_codon:yes stop_codon:yes gene_type:complete
MPRYELFWHQPQSDEIDSWEFQFQRAGSDEWEWVFSVHPVDDCLECFQAFVEIPASTILVRSRAKGDLGYSPWSKHLPIDLPEPGITASLLVGALFLAFTGSRRDSYLGGILPRLKKFF